MIWLWIYLIGIVVTFPVCRYFCWTSHDNRWHRYDRFILLLYGILWPISLPSMIGVMVKEHMDIYADHSDDWSLQRVDTDGNVIARFDRPHYEYELVRVDTDGRVISNVEDGIGENKKFWDKVKDRIRNYMCKEVKI